MEPETPSLAEPHTQQPFGALLRQLRLNAGLTQEALAERAGLSTRGIQDLERGVVRPQRQTAERLASALSVHGEVRARFDASATPTPRRRRDAGAPSAPQQTYQSSAQFAPQPLPVQLSSFVGRASELHALAGLLEAPSGPRLVTITGPGGTGKTRLALQVAERVRPGFSGGVCFVGLDAIRDPALVPASVARVFGLATDEPDAIPRLLTDFLGDCPTLLLLDNLEHLIGAPPFIAQLLAGCRSLHVLATSRSALNISGEQEFPLGPLSLADEALALFEERARAVRPDFRIMPDQRPTVAEICRRLDGLPLAIELAAARIRLLPLSAMVTHLQEHRLSLLTGGSVNAPQRQRTLRAAISWSYDLLPPNQQRLFRRLSVFSGGSTLEAIAAICDGDDDAKGDVPAPHAIIESLDALVTGSLLRQEQQASGEPRLGMLSTLRDFAFEQLQGAGELPALRRCHARWYLTQAEQAVPHLRSAAQDTWYARLDDDRENTRGALAWCQEQAGADPDAAVWGLRLTAALFWYWVWNGTWTEAAPPFRFFLAHPDLSAPDHARHRAPALAFASVVFSISGDVDFAAASADEALALARTLDDPALLALVLTLPFGNETDPDRIRRSTIHLEEGVHLASQLEHAEALGFGCMGLGNYALQSGDSETARDWYARALEARRQQGDKWGIAQALLSLADATSLGSEHAEAQRLLGEAIRLFPQNVALRAGSNVAMCLAALGAVALAAGQHVRAATILGAIDALSREHSFQLPGPHRLDYERAVIAARASVSPEGFQAAWESGQTMTLSETIDFALT